MPVIRMPNGTLIRVPDGVSKQQVKDKYISNFGATKWYELTHPVADQPEPVEQDPLQQQEDGPSMFPAAQADPVDAAPDVPTGLPPEEQMEARDTIATQKPVMAQFEQGPEDMGKLQRRLVDLGIRKPEDYHIPEEEYDRVTQDRLQAAMTAPQQTESHGGGWGEEAPEDDSQRSWWGFFKEIWKQQPPKIAAGAKAKSAATDRIKAENTTIGNLYLEGLQEQYESGEIGERAGQIAEESAAKHGMSTEDYAKYVAAQIDEATAEEFSAIEDYQEAQKKIEAVKPKSVTEGGWLPHIAGMVLENTPQLSYIIAGVATGRPELTMSLFGTDVYTKTFAQARSDGRSVGEATQDAFASTVIEAATEGVPVYKIAKLMRAGNKGKAMKLLSGLGTEAAQEMLAEGGQILYDYGVLDKEMTFGEAFARMRDAGVVGGLIGSVVSAPSVAFGDDKMADANDTLNESKKKLQSVIARVQNPNENISALEVKTAKEEYQAALAGKRKLVEEKLAAKKEKLAAKTKKKEAKAVKKMAPVEKTRHETRKKQAETDQSVKGSVTEDEMIVVEALEKMGDGNITMLDADAVKKVLDLGYANISKSGTPMVLPAGKRRVKAVRDHLAQGPQQELPKDEEIQPVKYESVEARDRQKKIDDEIGRLIRNDPFEPEITPAKFTSMKKRRETLAAKVEVKIKDPVIRNRIADDIIKSDQQAKAFEKRELEVAAEIEKKRDADYGRALLEQKEIEVDKAMALAQLDEASVSGYTGTRLGDVLRGAYQKLEQEEIKAKESLREAFWNKPVQGQLFDLTGVLVKGSKDYSNVVKVGALKIAKTGLKYSAWSADMVAELGESIKPHLTKIYQASKQHATNALRVAHRTISRPLPKKKEAPAPKTRTPRAYVADGAPKPDAGTKRFRHFGNRGDIAALDPSFAGTGMRDAGFRQGTSRTISLYPEQLAKGTPESGVGRNEFIVDIPEEGLYNANEDPDGLAKKARVPLYITMDKAAEVPTRFDLQTFEKLVKEAGYAGYHTPDADGILKGQARVFDKITVERNVTAPVSNFRLAKEKEPQGYHTVKPYLTKPEQDKLRRDSAKKLVDLFKGLPPDADYSEAALAGIAKKGWYEKSTKVLIQVFGEVDAPRFTALLAALSPQISVEGNLTNALHVWSAWNKAGRPQDADAIKRLIKASVFGGGKKDLQAWRNNSVRALSADDPMMINLSGPKVSSFMQNLIGNMYEVTNDTWMANFAFVSQTVLSGSITKTDPGKRPGYLSMSAKIRRVAEKLTKQTGETWTPAEVQETVWSWAKTAVEMADAYGENRSVEELVKAGAITDEAIANTVDFATLFTRDASIREILERAGYAQEIEALELEFGGESTRRDHGRPRRQITPGILRSARRLDRLRAERDRSEGGGAVEEEVQRPEKEAGTPLIGLPSNSLGPIADIQEAARLYVEGMPERINAPTQVRYATANPQRGARIAQAYEEMKHDPDNFQVAVAYDALIDETLAQYQLVKELGIKIEFIEQGMTDPYPDGPKQVHEDLRNNHLWVFPTEGGFGDAKVDRSDNPLLQPTKEKIGDRVLLANDVFRIVHDVFGHGKEGNGFGPSGEENAWQSHVRMYSPFAALAMTSETRGQNSWVNYGPNGEHNRANPKETIYADQKTGLLPSWVMRDGLEDAGPDGDASPEVPRAQFSVLKARSKEIIADRQASVDSFMEEMREGTTSTPLNADARVLDKKAFIEARPTQGVVWIDFIASIEHGEGHGNKALKFVVDLADKHGVELMLIAKSIDSKNFSQEDLVDWYRRNGFVGTSTMTRTPRPGNATSNFRALDEKDGIGSVSRQSIEEMLDKHFKPWFGITNYKVVNDISELPEGTRREVEELGITPLGVFYADPMDGTTTIYIVASTQPNIQSAIETILHETVGHYGMQGLLGPQGYQRMMGAILRDFPVEVAANAGLTVEQLEGMGTVARMQAAEELVARVAEKTVNGHELNKNQMSLWERIVAEVGLILSKMGLKKMSHEELGYLVQKSMKFVKTNAQADITKRAVQVQRMKDAMREMETALGGQFKQDDAFKKWFGDSKVVDEKGKPLVVYHGTESDVPAFDPNMTDDGAIYFTTDRDTASWFAMNKGLVDEPAPNVMPSYLSITNPLVLTMEDLEARIGDPEDKQTGIDWTSMIAVVDEAKGLGHDGLHLVGIREYNGRIADQWLAFRAEQIKSSIGNRGTFDPQHPNILFSALDKARDADPDLDRFLNKIDHGRGTKLESFRDWWSTKRGRIKDIFEIEIFDQFAGIKHLERELGILDAQSQAYVSVRLTAGTETVIRSALEYGVPIWDKDGQPAIKKGTRGMVEILAPVGQNAEMLKMFEAFLVARRAKYLLSENREKLLNRKEIASVMNYIRRNKLQKLFKQTADDLAGWKKGVLDFAEEAGLINKETRPLWERSDHVPFYRMLSDKNSSGPFAHSKIGEVGKAIHRLKGGTDILKNPLESMTQNIAMLIEASIKNKAMADIVRNFDGTGAITKAPQMVATSAMIPLEQVKDMLFEAGVSLDAVGQDLLTGMQKLMAMQPPKGDNVFHVQENGKKRYYYVHDAGLLRGLQGINPTQWIVLMKALRFPKRVLTRAITLTPDFILKNWFRDMIHSYVLGRHGTVKPIYDSMKGWAKAIRQDETFKEILSGGGMFDSGYVNASDPKKQNHAIRREILADGRGNILDTFEKLTSFYMRLANGAENAHRVIVYQKALKETGSRKAALFEARDLMDFSVRGANPIVRFLAETVPFWGARVQGLQRTGKGFTEHPAQTALKAIPIMLASVALFAMQRDDERYKGLSGFEKRMYYHFFDVFEKGDTWRLPKPFEIGALFSSIPEVLTEYVLSNEPDRGRQLAGSIGWIVREMFMLSPDVQLAHPLYELDKNWNSFTESPIISYWEQQLPAQDRWSHTTSPSVKWLAQKMPEAAPEWFRSPKQLEYLLGGYFGSMMDYGLLATDMLYQKMNPNEPTPPVRRVDETPFIKAFRRDDVRKYDKYVEELYEVMHEADKIWNGIQRNQKLGTDEGATRAKALAEDNMDLLYARDAMGPAKKALSDINDGIQQLYRHPTMSPEEKRKKIDELLKKRSEIAQKVYDTRPGGKANKYDGGAPVEPIFDLIKRIGGKKKDEQVDDLISANLPHTAILVNDINIKLEKLRAAAA